MGKEPRPEDWTQTVRENHRDAKAWVAASSEPCLSVRDDEVDQVDRILSGADFGNLPSEDERPDIWVVAVIVCPGDDLEPVIEWAKTLDDEDIDRVQFYYHSDVNVETVTTPWTDAGFPDPFTYEVEDFTTFHDQFGWEFNDQVYRDVTGWEPP